MNDTKQQLGCILQRVRDRGEAIPLLEARYAAADVEFRPFPAGMLEIISSSPDYLEIVPGDEPTWLKIIVDKAAAELVIYRTLADGEIYILGPADPTIQ